MPGLYEIYMTWSCSRYHTLESYGPNLVYAHRILVPILQFKLPNELRRKWEFQLSKLENEEDDLKVTVEYLFEFLRSHVMSEEAAEKSIRKERPLTTREEAMKDMTTWKKLLTRLQL